MIFALLAIGFWLVVCAFLQANINVRWAEQEVRGLVARTLVAACVIPLALLGALLAVLIIPLLIVTLPVTLPVHYVLRLSGCRGFARREGQKFVYSIDREAFRRAT